MSTVLPIVLAPDPSPSSQWLLESLLREQQEPSAVERFAQRRQDPGPSDLATVYRELMPVSPPGPGEQYAFEVDLDACSGCKACVTACHNLNGLQEGEVWRDVGLLSGGASDAPVLQHVTTACHHCLQPACLEGCPVKAYDKDPQTGVVRHLDDQCIGCQYCVLKCPYDVPKYSKSLGIVRKCDMCQQRLAVGEPPACVQGCPNQAIKIRVVSRQSIVQESEANLFLPGAPEPGYTLPSTVYKTNRPLPRNLLPADYYSARPQHAHLPLVLMLVLTQMSVGAFVAEQTLPFVSTLAAAAQPLGAQSNGRFIHLAAALLLGLLGLSASVFHLGRPWKAYRALCGLGASWLSREILAFGLFAALASAYVGAAAARRYGVDLPASWERTFGMAAAVVGLAGVTCSVMIYADTRRLFWKGSITGVKFFLTAGVLGIPVTLLISLAAAAMSDSLSVEQVMRGYGVRLCQILMALTAFKLLFEGLIFTHLRRPQLTPLKRTALLLMGELSMTTLKRFFVGAVGGLLLPLVLASENALAPQHGFHPLFVGFVTLLTLALLLAGELLERYLFFTAVVAPKMPGAPAS